jgi:predicted amidohydrolase
MAQTSFVAAAVQFQATANREDNLRRAGALVERAARAGASLVALPEVFSWRGAPELESAMAESIPGVTTEFLAGLARRHGIYLLGGSILERNEETRPFNTSVFFAPDGRILACYRKLHLFDVRLPGRVEILESSRRRAGDEVVVVETELARFGLAICYDLRFPELFRSLMAKGAEVILLPSAFTFVTGAAHWEILLRGRAIENQLYVIAPNQIGKGDGGVPNFGHSAIIDPWGIVVAQARDEECVILAEVDLEYLRKVRSELPCLEHVRLPLSVQPDRR